MGPLPSVVSPSPLFIVFSLSNFVFLTSLELANRFRTLATAHVHAKALETHLESACLQYSELVLAFAEDLDTARRLHGPESSYWVESGLCEHQNDAESLFSVMDAAREELRGDGPKGVLGVALGAHGRLLSLLIHLTDRLILSSPGPSREPSPAPMEVDAVAITPSSSKGKGKQREEAPESSSSAQPAAIPPERMGALFAEFLRTQQKALPKAD